MARRRILSVQEIIEAGGAVPQPSESGVTIEVTDGQPDADSPASPAEERIGQVRGKPAVGGMHSVGFRVLERRVDDKTVFEVVEVRYTFDQPTGWGHVDLTAGNVDELRELLDRMRWAPDRPVLQDISVTSPERETA